MKHLGISGVLCFVAIAALSQHGKVTLVASVSSPDRLSIVKNSIRVPVWHEKNFWPLYEDYLENVGEAFSSSYRSLTDLAKIDKHAEDEIAFAQAHKVIANRYALLSLQKKYYKEIGNGFNGIIALQFLQTEALLDMMECSRIYESTEWKNYRFHPKIMNEKQLKQAKHNTIAAALSLPPDRASAFWIVYTRYEEECDAWLGEDYSMVSLYAGEPSDFTPGLAKRLGYEFLQVMYREMKLKEKYFLEMDKAVGSSLAARFLAWEDYYSLVSKMYAWAEQ